MLTDWNAEAAKVADHIAESAIDAHRGAFAWHNGVVVAFGNRGADEVPHVHKILSGRDDATVLGFVLLDHGDRWTLLLRSQGTDDDARWLAEDLNQEVWAGYANAAIKRGGAPVEVAQYIRRQVPIAAVAITRLENGERQTHRQTNDDDA